MFTVNHETSPSSTCNSVEKITGLRRIRKRFLLAMYFLLSVYRYIFVRGSFKLFLITL